MRRERCFFGGRGGGICIWAATDVSLTQAAPPFILFQPLCLPPRERCQTDSVCCFRRFWRHVLFCCFSLTPPLPPSAFVATPALSEQHQVWFGGGGERGNDTSRSTGRSGRQNAATRRNMRRGERVTVQGPVKKQQPDGMSHGGGGGLSATGGACEACECGGRPEVSVGGGHRGWGAGGEWREPLLRHLTCLARLAVLAVCFCGDGMRTAETAWAMRPRRSRCAWALCERAPGVSPWRPCDGAEGVWRVRCRRDGGVACAAVQAHWGRSRTGATPPCGGGGPPPRTPPREKAQDRG